MKIAVASSGQDLEAPVDLRFGRAAGFIVYDTETGETNTADNRTNLNAAQGAGIQTAQNVAATGAGAVIAANYGPKAVQVLKAAGVKMYLCSQGTVGQAIEDYKSGKLTEASGANVRSHW